MHSAIVDSTCDAAHSVTWKQIWPFFLYWDKVHHNIAENIDTYKAGCIVCETICENPLKWLFSIQLLTDTVKLSFNLHSLCLQFGIRLFKYITHICTRKLCVYWFVPLLTTGTKGANNYIPVRLKFRCRYGEKGIHTRSYLILWQFPCFEKYTSTVLKRDGNCTSYFANWSVSPTKPTTITYLWDIRKCIPNMDDKDANTFLGDGVIVTSQIILNPVKYFGLR